jgi:hypothetical protein
MKVFFLNKIMKVFTASMTKTKEHVHACELGSLPGTIFTRNLREKSLLYKLQWANEG